MTRHVSRSGSGRASLPRVGSFSILVPAKVHMPGVLEAIRARCGGGALWVHGWSDNQEFISLKARCLRWYSLRQQAKRKGRAK